MGAILQLQDAKDYLDLDHDDFDSLVVDLIDEAEAAMQSYIGTPITATTFTEFFDGEVSKFFLDRFPIDETSVTVTDTETPSDATDDEVLVKDEDYRVRPEMGVIVKTTDEAVSGRNVMFGEGVRRFKVEYDAGLDQSPDWTREEKVLRSSLRELVKANFEDRNPRTSRRQFASGASRQSSIKAIPERVRMKWDRFAEALEF